MDRIRVKRQHRTLLLRVVSAIGISIALSGCIIVPAYGPHYYRPFHYGYY